MFEHIQGLRCVFTTCLSTFEGGEPSRLTKSFNEIWAWGGGTWGEGLAVLEDWMLGGLEVCFYDVFAHIQKLRCAFTTCLRISRVRTFPSAYFSEILELCFYDVFADI